MRYGSRYGRRAWGAPSTSAGLLPDLGGILGGGEKRVEVSAGLENHKVSIDVSLTDEDVDIIRGRTPARTGRLRDGFRIEGGDIVNDVPYVGVIEERTGMIADSMPEIMENLEARVKNQLGKQKLFNLPKVLGTIGG